MTTPDPRQIGCGGVQPPSQHAEEKAGDRLHPTAGSSAVRDLERENAAWVNHFVKPVARFMRDRGISELRIKIGKDGKASYLLEPSLKTK